MIIPNCTINQAIDVRMVLILMKLGQRFTFIEELKNSRITFEEVRSRLMRFDGLLDMLANTAARKDISKEKRLWS